MVELRRLRLLHQLSRLGTVAAVAEALSYSPSSVSVQLAQLEREAGAKLLRRAGRNVELTPAGERLARYAAEALAADEAVRGELAQADDSPRGTLRMTFVQTPALTLLPQVLQLLAQVAADLEVQVVQRETAPALDDLRSRAVDLVVGIEYEPVPVARHRDVDRQDLLREEVLLALQPQHPLLDAPGPVPVAACERLTWAAGQPGSGHDAVLHNVCRRLGGFEPDIRHRSDDALILAALVASGRAATLLPAMLTTAVPQVVARPVGEERLHRTMFTATRTTAADAPAVTTVRRVLRQVAASVAEHRADVEASG